MAECVTQLAVDYTIYSRARPPDTRGFRARRKFEWCFPRRAMCWVLCVCVTSSTWFSRCEYVLFLCARVLFENTSTTHFSIKCAYTLHTNTSVQSSRAGNNFHAHHERRWCCLTSFGIYLKHHYLCIYFCAKYILFGIFMHIVTDVRYRARNTCLTCTFDWCVHFSAPNVDVTVQWGGRIKYIFLAFRNVFLFSYIYTKNILSITIDRYFGHIWTEISESQSNIICSLNINCLRHLLNYEENFCNQQRVYSLQVYLINANANANKIHLFAIASRTPRSILYGLLHEESLNHIMFATNTTHKHNPHS